MGYHGTFGPKVGKAKYLLDMMPFASSAYSLRVLTKYNYGCMIVRRESDNAETPIGWTDDWVDFGAIKSFCGSSAGRVSTWYDQTYNLRNDKVVRDATASSLALQPYIWSGSSFYFDDKGNPRIFFNNANNELQAYKASVPSTNFTYSTVSSAIDVTGNNKNVVAADGGGFNTNGIYQQNQVYIFNRLGAASSIYGPYAVTGLNSKNFVCSIDYYSNTKAIGAINEYNSVETTISNYTDGARNYWMLGSYYVSGTRSTTLSLNGYISEHISFNNYLDIDYVRLNQMNQFV